MTKDDQSWKGLTFFLPAGSTTALVGPTGAGKVPSQILFSDIMMLIKGVCH